MEVTVEAEVGMGATKRSGSDRYAGTIVGVKKNTKGEVTAIDCVHDVATRVDKNGMSEDQTWEYERAKGTMVVYCFTRRRNGAWVEKGWSMGLGHHLTVGVRDHYKDPSF